MTRANRVQPDGSFATVPARGGFMGNRGCLHDAAGVIRRGHQVRRWITCTLREKPGRGAVPQSVPGRYTPLFFLDEAVACAAGHRPCAECRRAVYDDFRAAWTRAFGAVEGAAGMDAVLHRARWDGTARAPRRYWEEVASLPDGCFVRFAGQAHLVWDGGLRPYRAEGYGPAIALPQGTVPVLTPEPLVRVMAAGWRPVLSATEDRPNW